VVSLTSGQALISLIMAFPDPREWGHLKYIMLHLQDRGGGEAIPVGFPLKM